MWGGDVSPPNEPSLVQVLYDSLNEIKAAVTGISDRQTTQSIQLATILAQNSEALRREKELQARVDELESAVSDLKRTSWILAVVGGIVVAIATSVATEWINARVLPPERAVIATPPPNERS